jgi:REP element-mobilizing transposase RayT
MWHRLYYHLVWTTEKREPLLDAKAARFLSRFLRAIASRYRARVLAMGAVRTHVHVLLAASPQTDFPKLICQLKGGSSTIWNKDYSMEAGWRLRWSAGYGLSTVGRRQVESVRGYLRAQPFHHPDERIEGWEGERQSREDLR